MLKVPVTDRTFKKGFLDGNGELAVTPSAALASALTATAPFPEDAHALIAKKATGKAPSLKFGSGTIACTATFSGGTDLALTLLRTRDATELPPGASPPAPGRLGVLLRIGAQASANANATVAAPAGFSFGLSAKGGAQVSFERFREFDEEMPARAVLEAIFDDVRLPQSRGASTELPEAGEVVVFAYEGFLELAAALNWGYSLTGSEGFDIREIDAKLKYALRAKASLTLGYRLGGEFSIALRSGHADGWARLTVRKRRDSRFQAAAGFDFLGKADVAGLPETPNEFLAAFLGTDAKTVLGGLDTAVEATDVEELEKRAGKLLTGVLSDLSSRWTGGALDATRLTALRSSVRKAVEAYQSIDPRIVHTVLDLYEKASGPNRAAIERALAIVSGLSSPQDLSAITDQSVWQVIQQILGGEIFKLTSADKLTPFAELQGAVSAVRKLAAAPEFEKLRDFMDVVASRLKLDELFGRLEKISTATDLRKTSDPTLQGLVERIVGRSFHEIEEREFGKVAKDVHLVVTQLQKFKNAFAEKVEAALHQSVQVKINYLYTHARSDRTLVDVEIDVRSDAGRTLFDDVAAGRMRGVFDAAAHGGGVMVHEGLLTHELTRSSQLQINVLGWGFKRLVEFVTKTDISLQAHAGGLVQVFTTTGTLKQIEESGGKHKERMQTNFLLRMAGETFGSPGDPESREYLIRTLERMSIDYDLVQSDDMTDIDELTEFVSLGRRLGLVQDGLIDELKAQFGRRLGKVKATYTVRFDHKAVHDAFVARSGDALDEVVRSTARRLVAASFVRKKNRGLAAVGLAYRDGGQLLQKHRDRVLDKQPITVTMPAWLKDGARGKVSIDHQGRQLLDTLFAIEESLARRIVMLDGLVDDARMTQRAVPVVELEKAVEEVLARGAQMDGMGGPNTFFGIFDALVRIGGRGKAHRESVFTLEVTPPGGQTVTKFFMDSPLVDQELDA